MAVSVDTVYQRVLAILNKEQRGFVTPQEFNLFANQAQLDIFEQYFYDINQYSRVPGNDTQYSDMLNILNEKINLFETNAAMVYNAVTNYWSTPANLYRLGTVVYGNEVTSLSLYPTPNTSVTTTNYVEAERTSYNAYLSIAQSEYLKPTNSRPVFVANQSGYRIYGSEVANNAEKITNVSTNYIRVPLEAAWGYQMVYGEALYDPTTSVNFELHDSEETELVIKVLEFAGLAIKDIQMYQIANSIETQTNQQEKQ